MARILDTIHKPADLRELRTDELQQLAREVREELISTVTSTGGHLASNLGVVELTMALHRVFDSPEDKLIWDVGHQSYVHKLFTGRREKFRTLRQYGGLSGFTDMSESPHDPFGAGHASTSVSAAVGMAEARDLKKGNYDVVAIIGDGALTGGMAFEALNHAGHLGIKLIVVLNDNGMSISPTVGALSNGFNKLRLSRRFRRAKAGAKHAISHAPLGKQVWQLGTVIKDGLKRLVIPSMLWEELGFIYLGPVDGHDISAVEVALQQAQRSNDKPVLVHVVTVKGKGYHPAEKDAVGFHGIPPSRENGNGGLTYSAVFSETMRRLLRDDPRVVVVTAAMGEGNHLTEAHREFPERVIDVGICEQHAVTFSAGLAAQGLVPVVAVYSTFLQRAFDQLVHDVCLQDLHVVFALDRAGIVGDDGKTHQGTFDLSYLSLVPNMMVSAPKDENELQHLLFTATRVAHPIAIRYPRGRGPGFALESELKELPAGKSELLHSGDDISILAVGATVVPALKAAEKLSASGIQAAVVNCRFVKPLDSELVCETAERTGRVLVVEENVAAGGLGSAVSMALHANSVKADITYVNVPDEFVEHGPQSVLRARYCLDEDGIKRKAMELFEETGGRKAGSPLSTGHPL
ncbi:MAG: 1-deoxy-D-xylulose-5-phosphate synthase [Chloroflexi bacterium]|nr:1-deoxy-D-xylulose-5-phosphate synthase [Chloroflexota bacterium]